MESCVRGFSFMPEKVEIMDLQYIESGELERTWKTSRRQRLKEQEQRIWEDFVKEQDVLKSLCKDDPYQFLNQLPESCLKELLETEYQKMKRQAEEETVVAEHQPELDDSCRGDGAVQHVTFADDDEIEDGEFFHIFDDENDKDDELSGPEEEALNDSMGSPSTVRERLGDSNTSLNRQSAVSPDKDSKTSENVTNVIESSIYCAKVKDLRMKINEELLAIISSLDRQDVASLPPEEVSRRCKRSDEFCTRFNRIYMYQLQRQIQDVKRSSNLSLPFAKHTQFQSQMIRIVSLHQNMLQAFQVFHKSFAQTSCLRASGAALRAAAALCRAAPAPRHFAAAAHLYDDEVLISCDKLDEAVNDYSMRTADFLSSADNTSTSPSKKTVKKGKKKSFGSSSKSGSKSISETEARLSMYSLDTLRINHNPKSISSKDNQSSGTSKMRGPASSVRNSCKLKEKNEQIPKNPSRSPRSRGPLMRDPQRGRPRDSDIRTMVEAVDMCTSSHVSREGSPAGAAGPRGRSARPSPRAPRTKILTPRMSQNNTPRPKIRTLSPNAKERRSSPRTSSLKLAMSSIKTDPQDTIDSLQEQITPVSRIQCAQKDRKDGKECNSDKNAAKDGEPLSPQKSSRRSPRIHEDASIELKSDRDRARESNIRPASCEVTRLLKQLCSGDNFGTRNERVSGTKNAQLFCVSGGSPRQPSTPQLLRILEETIQKKVPKPMYKKRSSMKDTERFRLTFNISEKTADTIFQYRTKFVQHMLTSPLYANSAVGKPWEMIGSVSEKIIDELLLGCAKEMQLKDVIQGLYKSETS